MDSGKTGTLIAEARKAKGLTQRQLAETLHISDRTVSKWERGAGFPDVALLEPLADALGLTVRSLLRGEAEPPEAESAGGNIVPQPTAPCQPTERGAAVFPGNSGLFRFFP